MGKVIIVDDQQYFSKKLKEKVLQFIDEEIYIFNSFDLDYFKNNDVDLLLLDIELNGVNGIDAAMQLRKIDKAINIAFVTSHKEIVFEVFKTGPIYFISKDNLDTDLMWMFRELNRRGFRSRPILETKHHLINKNNIIYLESNLRNVIFNLVNQRCLEERGKLEDYLNQLEEYNFIRVNKSFVINASYIVEIKGSVIYLENGKEIRISKKYKNAFNVYYSMYHYYKK